MKLLVGCENPGIVLGEDAAAAGKPRGPAEQTHRVVT